MSGVQFIIGRIANALSPQAKAISDLILGQPALLASWADLVQKADNGTATWEYIIEPTMKLECLLSATALLTATTGAQPAAVIVGAAAAALFVWKQRGVIANADATVKSYFENRYAQLENSIRDEFGISRIFEPPVIAFTTNTATTDALNWVRPRRDPLVLDLDGNGITTSAIKPAAPILFDQDGDGTKTATGWIASGEAIVVRDLNGNAKVDSGRELFGDNTILTRGPHAGQVAANGFEAQADLDSNADGKFDAADTLFTSLRFWRDLNQNSTSEAGELSTFADLGLASINVTGTATNINLGGGNTQTHSGIFTRTTGQTGAAATAERAGSLLLANNNFYRDFTDDLVLTDEAWALLQITELACTCKRSAQRRYRISSGLRSIDRRSWQFSNRNWSSLSSSYGGAHA